MNKKEILDLGTNYYSDIITCFERPIAVALQYRDEKMADMFIMLSKMFGIFSHKKTQKEALIASMREFLGYEIEYCKLSYDNISKVVNEGGVCICGINLRYILLNCNYREKDWPHWTIITGVSKDKKTLDIFDNMQYKDANHKYEGITISYKDIKYAHKMYKKQYGKEFDYFYIKKSENYTKSQVLRNILIDYCYKYKSSKYQQICLIEKLSEMSQEVVCKEYLQQEYMKRIININKYRQAFMEILINEMNNYCYVEEQIKEINTISIELNKEWSRFVMVEVIQANNNYGYKPILTDRMIDLYSIIENNIRDFIKHIEKYDENAHKQITCEDEVINSRYENNEGGIARQSATGVCFEFMNKNTTYNWWEGIDKAPKYVLEDNVFIKGYKTKIKISIQYECGSGNFQMGIFFRGENNEEIYTIGIENNSYIFLDKIGKYGYKEVVSIRNNYSIYCAIEQDILEVGIMDEKEEISNMLKMNIDTQEMYDIGFFCKTWDKPVCFVSYIEMDKHT